ncbi:MAG: PD-(D/E)XK nuclease family protein [Bryobacteraceae bacterium]
MPLPVDALRCGATLVTAGARLARQLTQDYDRHRARAGNAAWEAADILPWTSWLERCWHIAVHMGGAPVKVLLAREQEEVLWQRIVEHSSAGGGLLSSTGAAAEALKAYRLLHSWELSLADPSFSLFDDPAEFRNWALEFELLQKENNWLSSARLEREIGGLIERGDCAAPARLIYAGFDQLTPAQRRLLGAMRSVGCEVEELPFPAADRPAVSRVGMRESKAEYRAAAGWARSRLLAAPEARIGVVVPELTSVLPAVERIFDEVLHPSIGLGDRGRRRAYHISAGQALTEIPVVAAALSILALGRGPLTSAEAGRLLRTPFLAGAGEELGSRALVDVELRRRGLYEVSLAALARAAADAAPEMSRRLSMLRDTLAGLPRRQGASGWSRDFSRLLRAAGWPGDRTPDSVEYQTIQRWHDLLSSFAAIEAVAEPMDYSSALAGLRHLAAQTQFAPADEGAPVQIMGILEAAGSEFDHLWIAGLEDRAWPPPPRPSPFLPGPLQRSLGMPHSSAEGELSYARRVTARLLGSAPEVVVSYPLRDADSDLRPSPLIRHLPETPCPGEAPGRLEIFLRSHPGLEQREDSSAPRLPEGTLQRGGTAVIEKQAACPFRAFAEYRLGGQALEEPSIGFSAQERGQVAHSALELFWGEVKSHAALMAMSGDDLSALVSRVVRMAVERRARGRGVESMPRIQSLERDRLERLIKDWLEIERARSAFEVAASERERLISIGGLALQIKVDRVDTLAGGRQVIIDYKTGRTNPSDWEGDRPDAPQLPLYAATHSAPVGAVAFAQLTPGELQFKGLGEGAGIPGVREYSESTPGKAARETLEEHISAWGRTLEGLAREFVEGVASVTPKRDDTCLYCPLPALCRIGDLPPRMEEESGGEEANG